MKGIISSRLRFAVFGVLIPIEMALGGATGASRPFLTDQNNSSDEEPTLVAAAQAGSQSRRSRRRRRSTSYKVVEVKEVGTITGTVVYQGPIPAPRKINIVKDHETCGHHPTEVPLIFVDDQKRVADAVVFLADIRQGKAFPKEAKTPKIDQQTCEFHPHVQAVRAREEVDIVNSDPVAHNINATQRIYTLFNILQPLRGMTAKQKFDKPGVVNLRCNVHEWMRGYVHVFNHPYYVVTGADGAFRLDEVPPGTYELAVWQEHLGEQTFAVDVKPGETTDLKLELKASAEAK